MAVLQASQRPDTDYSGGGGELQASQRPDLGGGGGWLAGEPAGEPERERVDLAASQIGAPPAAASPNAPSPYGGNSTQRLGRYGGELMDPDSDYSKLMQSKLSEGIGEDVEARRRLASFDAAQSGMGAGGSPELASMLTDIGIEGAEQQGKGMVNLLTGNTQLGLGAMGSAQQGELGYAGQNLQKQLAANQEKFNRWQTEQQQRESQQQREKESWYENQRLEIERQRQAEEAKWREFSMSQSMGGGYGGGGSGGGGGGGYPSGGSSSSSYSPALSSSQTSSYSGGGIGGSSYGSGASISGGSQYNYNPSYAVHPTDPNYAANSGFKSLTGR